MLILDIKIIGQNNDYTFLEKKEVEPTEPVQKNVYESDTYRKDLSWLYFNDQLLIEAVKKGTSGMSFKSSIASSTHPISETVTSHVYRLKKATNKGDRKFMFF